MKFIGLKLCYLAFVSFKCLLYSVNFMLKILLMSMRICKITVTAIYQISSNFNLQLKWKNCKMLNSFDRLPYLKCNYRHLASSRCFLTQKKKIQCLNVKKHVTCKYHKCILRKGRKTFFFFLFPI